MTSVPGLTCHHEFVTAADEEALLAAIAGEPWLTSLRRRVQHYGYRYDYKARSVDRDMYLGPLPTWAAPILERLRTFGAFDRAPDQLIVNEYEPGQGIAPHVDCVPCFGPVVASLSLGSRCVMEFSQRSTEDAVSILLPSRALLLLQGDARYLWRHAIRPRRNDRWDGAMLPRGRRVSLTFRTVRLAP